MFSNDADKVPKGSWRWTLGVSERTALATIALFFIVLHVAHLSRDKYLQGLGLFAGQVAISVLIFRVLLPRSRRDLKTTGSALALGALLPLATVALFTGEIPSVRLFFLPFIVIAGLLGNVPAAAVASATSIVSYLGISAVLGRSPGVLGGTLNSALFLFSGFVAGVLSRELREHYRRELTEHRRAITIGHRLTAVVDAVEEALVFADQQGVVRLINRRAADLFDVDPSDHVGSPAVQLQRLIARLTEDPEGFMESLQIFRDDPLEELSLRVEQIIPARRILQMLSRPVVDDSGVRVGRIDVYADVTEAERRAAEAERLYREARETAESYQRALLPTQTPSLPRLTLVAHYIPAAGKRAVCGDFYDFLSLPDGTVGAVLGDVCGVGPTAVNDAALTRYTISSLARTERDPGRLLELTNVHAFDRLGIDRFVRVFIGVLDPERAVLEFANAGHVPPVLFRASSGRVEWLEEGGLPLGVEREGEYKTTHVELEPGDTLFLYTDGVNEAPRRGDPFGQGKLSDLVRHFGYGTPGELVQGVRRAVEGWVDEELRDDLAMVGVQVVPDVAVAEPTRELVLPNDPARIREVRSFVSEFLTDLRAPVDASSDVLLAASEAASNAMKYGRFPESRSELRIQCVLAGTEVIVVIADEGPGLEKIPIDQDGIPDPLALGGRGMFLMKELTDDLQIESTPQGTTIVLRRRVFEEPPLPV
jgi:serine phosphatase RsbU (regulator of sigma subunit)/anti-sigma regulatory factor (Ser/Thr protein kinase)